MKIVILLLYEHFSGTYTSSLDQVLPFYLQGCKKPRKPPAALGAPQLFRQQQSSTAAAGGEGLRQSRPPLGCEESFRATAPGASGARPARPEKPASPGHAGFWKARRAGHGAARAAQRTLTATGPRAPPPVGAAGGAKVSAGCGRTPGHS